MYLAERKLWKIADFGFSTETSSRTTTFTEHSRGTSSYRAPELIAEVSTFSNKVDIWGMGCILYELAVKEKAFEHDWSVRQYATKKLKLVVRLEYFFSDIKTLLTNLIHEMLQVNPRTRPNAQELHALFVILIDASSIPTLESDNLLLSKIRQPLQDDSESSTDQPTVYV